jgi:hypothetical protein
VGTGWITWTAHSLRTRNLNGQIHGQRPQTLNPKPQTPNANPNAQTPNPKSQISSPKSHAGGRVEGAEGGGKEAPKGRPAGLTDYSYLTQSIYSLISENQLPQETVNLIFSLVEVNNKLTIVWQS